jgi:hypothetical protein
MSTARVIVIHDFIAADGKWRFSKDGETTLPAAEARELDGRGYVDLLEVDGEPVVWSACCSGGDHDHS